MTRRRRLARQRPRRRTEPARLVTRPVTDERGSILIVVAFILFASLVLASVAQLAVAQLNQGSRLVAQDNALQGATTGIQAMVADMRGATQSGSPTTGVLTSLPCSALTGSLPASNGGAQYRVSVTYNLISTVGGAGQTSTCLSGGLPTNEVLNTATVASSGTDGSVTRSLQATYNFQTTYTPIPGGQILSYDNLDCLTSNIPSTNPGAGPYTLEVTTSCPTPASAQETFVYNANWTLETVVGGVAWCIQNPWEVSPSPTTNSPPAALVQCTTTTGSAPNSQEWGIDNSAPLEGVGSSGSSDNYCLVNPIASGTTSATTQNVTAQGCSGGFGQAQTWQMTQTVGAGDAAPASTGTFFGPTDQLVNFQQFGRCLDVNGQTVGNNSLIVYPCKQYPNPNEEPIWNQRWCFQSLSGLSGVTTPSNATVGILYTPNPYQSWANNSAEPCAPSSYSTTNTPSHNGMWTNSSTGATIIPECLVPEGYSPNSGQDGYSPPGSFVSQPFVQPCNLSDWPPSSGDVTNLEAKDMLWVQWGSSAPTAYSFSYSVYSGDDAGYANSDYQGQCFEAGALGTASGGDQYSFGQMAACNGSWVEKWNTPPSYAQIPLSNTYEPTTGGG